MFNFPTRWRMPLISGVALAATVPGFFVPRIPQNPAYHNFADCRAWLGVPNFGDVDSNVLFLAIGLYGLAAAVGQVQPARGVGAASRPAAFWPYVVFFIGVILTCVGSAYYHWSPSNDRLVWDRLPMSVGFMGLLAATMCERVCERLGQVLLIPLVFLGLFSVLFWAWTESAGRGDLRPYYAVQFVSLPLVLPMVLLFSSAQGGSIALLASVALYVAAKVCEVKDRPLLDAVGISGHTLKHMLAALSILLIAQMLARRARRERKRGQPASAAGLASSAVRFTPGALFALFLPVAALGQTTAADFYNRGIARHNKGDHDGAIAEYSRAIELDPKLAVAYNNRGETKYATGDVDGAITDCSRAIELDPKYAPAYTNRGNARGLKGDLDGAIADHTRAIELNPKLAEAYSNRGNARQAKGDDSGAIADYSRAIELDPKYARAYGKRGNAHFRQRHWADALADFRRDCELNPKKQDYPRFDIWLIRARLDEKDAANKELATYMDQRTEGTPGDWPSKIGSFLLDRVNQTDFLTAAASKNAKIDRRQHREAWFYTGMMHLLDGDKAAAAGCFTKCLATGEKSSVHYGFVEAELRALDK